jgi:hypothetical protein
MVSNSIMAWLLIGAAQQPADPVIERLDPPRRAAVIMALLALVLTGLFLVTCVMLGAHWVRRLARHKPSARSAIGAEPAVPTRALHVSIQPAPPEIETSDTIQLDTSSKETKGTL